MDNQTKLSILQSKEQCSLLITTKNDSEKQVFIERVQQKGLLHYIKVSYKEEICVSSVTQIRCPHSKKVLYPPPT